MVSRCVINQHDHLQILLLTFIREHLKQNKTLQYSNFYKGEKVNMGKDVFIKGVILGIIFLFIGTGIVPSIHANNEGIKVNQEVKIENDATSVSEPKYYAVVIGVEKFLEIDDLPEDKLDDNAIDIYNLLINSKNWERENIKLLLNENATKDSIRDSIVNWLDERETENDVVVYYFAGHSLKMPLLKRHKGHAYSCPYDITNFQYSEDKITDIELDRWLDELDSKHVTLILDTCYSGKMTSLCQKNRVVLTAGGKHFFCGVDESDALGNGIFTFFLLQGFKGIADINNDGWVSAEETYRYARLPTIFSSIWQEFPFIQEWKNQTIIWFFQIPRMYDQYPGNMLLVQYQYN